MANLGKSFINTFSTKTKDNKQSALPQPEMLSTKMGINKKKTTQLQQNILNTIQQPQGLQQQGA
jgi:hypothetical protein